MVVVLLDKDDDDETAASDVGPINYYLGSKSHFQLLYCIQC